MKNLIKTVAVVLLAVSCQRVQMVAPQTQYGSLGVSLKTESEIVTKAESGVSLTTADLNLSVVENSSLENKYNGKYTDYQALNLPMGYSYLVSAENCTAAEAEKDNGQIRVYGSQTVTISSLSNNVNFTCTVQNARVEVAFDPSVATYTNGLKVQLTNGTRTREVSSSEVSSSADPCVFWFNPTATFSWIISGTLKETSAPISKNGSRALAAKDNILLNVSIDASNGQLTITQNAITIDTTIKEGDTIDVLYNPYEIINN